MGSARYRANLVVRDIVVLLFNFGIQLCFYDYAFPIMILAGVILASARKSGELPTNF